MVGQTFHRLTILRIISKSSGLTKVECLCSCGNVKVVRFDHLRSGATQSCGCLHRQRVHESNSTHRLSGTPEYHAYYHARRRCENSKDRMFPQYGGRGIEFKFRTFEEFHSHLGPRPSRMHSLDRIDNNGHYEIGNVRWATWKEQTRNKRNSFYITINGDRKHINEWAEQFGIDPATVKRRISHYGFTPENAVTALIKQRQS